MVTKATVEEVIDRYHIRVRIPIINKVEGVVSSTPFNELYIASINCSLGSIPSFQKGDVVFVAFEEDEYEYPVIIGQLFRENSVGICDQVLSTLEVTNTCSLPEDTKIGDITCNDLISLKAQLGIIKNITTTGGVGFTYETPTKDNTDGLIIAILDENPVNKYSGYIYIIRGQEQWQKI